MTLADGIPRIDLVGLEPPAPLVAVLELIERPGVGSVVEATFPREPLNLFPELRERGWSWSRVDSGDPDRCCLRLVREQGETAP